MGFKDIFKTAFPFLSAAASLGGPLGSMAANAVGKALGIDPPSKAEDISDAVALATTKDPDALLKLKQADQDFSIQMAKLGFDSAAKMEELVDQDRSNARAREIAVKDKVPAILAISVTAGFFGLLTLMSYHTVPAGAHDILIGMLGSLGTAWIAIISYYFGSSAGSAKKTDMMMRAQSNQ